MKDKANEDTVILVDTNDQVMGYTQKLKAHQHGQCHRAFSIFIFRKTADGIELLIQQRQIDKYHCGGLWTNTCCSHPRPHEQIIEAGQRRLYEELGLQIPIKPVGEFHYIAHFDNGLTENEYDHVLVGWFNETKNSPIYFNSEEIAAIEWIEETQLINQLTLHPEHFTPWFKQALAIALKAIK